MCWCFLIKVENKDQEDIFYAEIKSIKELKELYNRYNINIPDTLFNNYDIKDVDFEDDCLCSLNFGQFTNSLIGDIVMFELNGYKGIGFTRYNDHQYTIIYEDNFRLNDYISIIFKSYDDLFEFCELYHINTHPSRIKEKSNEKIKFEEKDLFEKIISIELEKNNDVFFNSM